MKTIIMLYPGYHGSTGACGLSFDAEARLAVVVELKGSQFTSVTNAAENIAPIVAKEMSLPLSDFRLFEVYQNRIRDGVDFDASEVFATNGLRWEPVNEQDQKSLISFLRPWELRHPPRV